MGDKIERNRFIFLQTREYLEENEVQKLRNDIAQQVSEDTGVIISSNNFISSIGVIDLNSSGVQVTELQPTDNSPSPATAWVLVAQWIALAVVLASGMISCGIVST